MKKILAIVLPLAVIGGLGWYVLTFSNGTEKPNPSSNQIESTNPEIKAHLEGANIGESVDRTNQETVDLTIDDFIFEQTIVKVSTGTTVTWTNNGQTFHNVSNVQESPKQGLRGELLDTGETFSYTFDEPGLYFYQCDPHPFQMRGVVEVIAQGA